VASCVWRAHPELIVALDSRFGDPLDAYVNGSQVWLREDGPVARRGGEPVTLEWRLHPVGGYQRPPGVGTYEVFPTVALALGTGGDPAVPVETLWDGLEAFAAYGDEAIGDEPEKRVEALREATTAALGLAPDACGLVDHDVIGEEWERSGRRSSIIGALLAQLGAD
jgi:hypothetical protein